MRCINCGVELPDGAKFCFSCGAKQPEEAAVTKPLYEEEEDITVFIGDRVENEPYEEQVNEEPINEEPVYEEAVYEDAAYEEDVPGEGAAGYKFCPYCGARNDADAVFCCSCGNNMETNLGVSVIPQTEQSGKSRKPNKKFPVKLIAGAAVAVVVIVGGVKLIGGLFGEKENMYLPYLKDGHVVQANLDKYKKKPVIYEGRYDAPDYNKYANVCYSKDGKYIFYPTEVSYESDGINFRLNMQKVGKTKNTIRLDNSVRRYTVLENNKVVYIKSGSDTLYITDKKGNKEKISSDVETYYIDEDEKNIVWVEEDSGKYSIYKQDLNLKKDDAALIKDVDNYAIGKNLKQIAAMEEDTLYVIKDLGEKEKVSSDVVSLLVNNENGGCIYYTKDAAEKQMASDLVDDDCAATDKALKEPNYDDPKYKIEKVEKSSWTGKYEKVEEVDQDKYDADWEAYRAKERRDEMRSSLGETEVMVQGKELYCYNDGKSKLVDPAFAENYSYSDAKEFVFNRYNMEDVPKVKLSEVEYADEVEGAYFENVEKSVQTCVYTGGKTVALNEVLNQTIVVDSEAKKGYGIRSEEEDTTLYSFDIDSKTDGKTEVVAEDVEDIMGVRDGKIYYLTDVKNGSGELYCNDKNIDSDVTEGEVEFLDDDILYATDMNSDKGRYTLKLYDGKDDTKIADDVRVFRAFDKKHIAVLTDYRLERGEGDLKLYRGKKELYDLDEDVNWIFGSTRFYY